jgi:DNA polymerase-3 subunit beta
MKFVVSSKYLQQQLAPLQGVVPSSSTMAILLDFLFIAQDNQLTVVASDLESTMVAKLTDVQIGAPGQVAIPARILLETLKTFSDIPLTIQVDTNTWTVSLISNSGKYKLAGHNPSEFPEVPGLLEGSSMEIEALTLSTALSKTLFATGNDDLRPVMSGVLIQIGDSYSNFVATDSHKLVKYTRMDAKSAEGGELIVPKKPLNVLKSVLGSSEAIVKVAFDKKMVCFSYENIQLFSRQVEGKYPNYEVVIPKNNNNKLIVDKAAFLNALKRVSIFANKSTFQVRLKIMGGTLNISAEDLDFSNEANEELVCQFDGEDMEIGFNSRILIEILNNIEQDSVQLELADGTRPGLLSPAEYQRDIEDITMLVMPIMLAY